MTKNSFDLQDYDPLKVGMNIRSEREKAVISIAKLSADVNISAGKISYLEKGKIKTEHLPELEAIAAVLNIPITNILNEEALIKPPLEEYYSDIELALQFVAGGLLKEATKIVDGIKKKTTSKELKWIQPALFFIDAEIYLASGEKEKALEHFKMISNLHAHNSLLNHYKVRSLNALACDSFNKHRIPEAIAYVKRSLIHTDKNLSAEHRANTYYNLALFYGFVGYSDIAVMHAKNAQTLSHDNTLFLTEIRFALGILYMILEDTELATSYISEALSFYQKTKDYTSIGNLYKCFYTLYRIDPHKYASVRTFFEEDYLTVLNNETNIHIDYLHTWIELMLEQRQLEHAEKHIEHCIHTIDKMPNHLNFKTYWLASRFYKITNQSNKQEKALTSALHYVDDTMKKEEALIKFELAELREPKSNSQFHDVALLFQEVLQQSDRNRTIEHLLNLIPKPRY